MGFFGPFPETTSAHYTDGTHKWYGEAPKGATVASSSWKIFKMEYTGDNWVIKYPVDTTTDKATDAPKFVWNDVASLTYRELGT